MNITELRYLVAIMKWGSVSAAAKQLYAAQPNVSKALKNLEEEYHRDLHSFPTRRSSDLTRACRRSRSAVPSCES